MSNCPECRRKDEVIKKLRSAGRLALDWLSDEEPEWKPYKKLKEALALAGREGKL